MAKTKHIEIIGEEELAKRLRMVSDGVKGKELQKAVRAGIGVLRDEVQRRAPVRRGILKRNIGTKTKVRSPVEVEGSVGFKRAGWYGRLVEMGHAIVSRGKVVGHVPAHPFLRPAFDTKRGEIVAKIRERFRLNIAKATRGHR